ncbi:hypothetical protein D9M71_381840 [compost metagenome]
MTIDRIGVSGPLDVKQALGKSGAGFRHWRRNRKHGPRSVPRAEESKVEHEAIFLIIQNLLVGIILLRQKLKSASDNLFWT